MEKIKIIILAAGKGKRMKSDGPKALVKVGNISMISRLLESIQKSGIDEKPVVIVGYQKERLVEELGKDYDYVVQKEQLGTGNAVMCAKEFLKDKAENVMVLPSDHPFISAETIKKLAQKHLESKSKVTLATIQLADYKDWRQVFYSSFSRIIRSQKGEIIRDSQFKDATEEEKKITEVNPIYFCFEAKWLWSKIDSITNDNVQKEYYLTDLIKIAIEKGVKIESINVDPREGLAANSQEELEMLEKLVL